MDERGRFLERLQHPVGGLASELVRALDHEYAALSFKRSLACGCDHRAIDVANEDLVRTARGYPGEVRVDAGDRTFARSVGIDRSVRQPLCGQGAGGGALSCASGAVEEICVRRP